MKFVYAAALALCAMLGAVDVAEARCRPGQVSALCANGSYNCCMPAGARDCGNGRHSFSPSGCSGGGDAGRYRGPSGDEYCPCRTPQGVCRRDRAGRPAMNC